jgi:hypothetical protein
MTSTTFISLLFSLSLSGTVEETVGRNVTNTMMGEKDPFFCNLSKPYATD